MFRNLFWYWLPVCAHAGLIYYLSSRSAFPVEVPPWAFWADKVVHMGLFGLLALLLIRAWHLSRGRALGFQALLAVALLVSLYGVSDEVHQMFVPGRSPSVHDWLADTVGAALVCAGYWGLICQNKNEST